MAASQSVCHCNISNSTQVTHLKTQKACTSLHRSVQLTGRDIATGNIRAPYNLTDGLNDVPLSNNTLRLSQSFTIPANLSLVFQTRRGERGFHGNALGGICSHPLPEPTNPATMCFPGRRDMLSNGFSGLRWFPPNSPTLGYRRRSSLELVSPLQVTHLPPVWDLLLPLA